MKGGKSCKTGYRSYKQILKTLWLSLSSSLKTTSITYLLESHFADFSRWFGKRTVTSLVFGLSFLTMYSAPIYASTKATWYSHQSALDEGNSGITASGEVFKDDALTCALRSRDFGKRYKVTNLKNNKSVVLVHNDFGPSKKQVSKGITIDLSPAAFDRLGGKRGFTKSGIPYGEIQVKVEAL